MKSNPTKLPFLLLLTAAAAFSAHLATAGVILSSSATAPVAGLEDPNYLLSGGDISQYPFNQGYSDKAPGQSFTITGSGSFTLDSFSLLGANAFGGGVETGTWAVRVSEVSLDGTTVTPLLTVNAIASPTLTGTDWLTWTFTDGDVLTLTAGTTYAVQVLANSGYYGFTGDTASPYTGGTAFNTGGSYAFGGTSVSALSYDQTFIANVTAVPEPSSAALVLGVCATAVVSFRRRIRHVAPR